jgi:hypothetical protein
MILRYSKEILVHSDVKYEEKVKVVVHIINF